MSDIEIIVLNSEEIKANLLQVSSNDLLVKYMYPSIQSLAGEKVVLQAVCMRIDLAMNDYIQETKSLAGPMKTLATNTIRYAETRHLDFAKCLVAQEHHPSLESVHAKYTE